MSHDPKSINDDPSSNESVEYKIVSYAVVSDDLNRIIMGEKLPLDIKTVIQCEIAKQEQLPEQENIKAHSDMLDFPSKVSPSMMKGAQEEDVNISNTTHYVKSGKKPTLA